MGLGPGHTSTLMVNDEKISIDPWKMNMEKEKLRFLVQMIFLFNWEMFRFQPLIFRGVSL